MTAILHEHWELRARAKGKADGFYVRDGFGDPSWSLDRDDPVRLRLRPNEHDVEAARPLLAEDFGDDYRIVVVHVVRRKRGEARRQALEEAASVTRTHHDIAHRAGDEDSAAALSDLLHALDRLAKGGA